MRSACLSFVLVGALACAAGCSSANGGGTPNSGGTANFGGASSGGSGFGGSAGIGPGGQSGSGGSSSTGGTSASGGAGGTKSGSGGTSSGSGGTKSGSGGTSGGGSGAGGSAGSSSGIRIIVEPNGNKGAELVNAIDGAKSSVHMTMYLLTSSEVISALISQHQAGVQVQVLLDHSGSSNNSAYSQLSSAGVSVHWSSSQFTYTHEKCVILDKKEAWIMTMNATYSAPIYNREYLAIDDNAADVAEAETIFEGDFAGNPPSSANGPLVVAPINAVQTIVSLIQSAKKTIDLEGEEFSDYHTANAISAAATAGVQVHIVLASGTSTSTETTAINQVKAAGAKVVTLANPYMHAKALVVDGTTAYVGSENFSTGSLEYNRELGVVFSTPSEVAKVLNTTNSDFSAGTPR